MAGSRSGVKSVLIVSRMSPDRSRLMDEGTLVYGGHTRDPHRRPKFYKELRKNKLYA